MFERSGEYQSNFLVGVFNIYQIYCRKNIQCYIQYLTYLPLHLHDWGTGSALYQSLSVSLQGCFFCRKIAKGWGRGGGPTEIFVSEGACMCQCVCLHEPA